MADAVEPGFELGETHRIDHRVPPPPLSPGEVIKQALLTLPYFARLLYRLLRDPRVPRRRKLIAGAAAAYLAMPIDLIPDFVPVAGQVDDVIFAAFAIHHLLEGVPAEVHDEYWDGNEDTLDLLRSLVAWGAEMVPKQLRSWMAGAP